MTSYFKCNLADCQEKHTSQTFHISCVRRVYTPPPSPIPTEEEIVYEMFEVKYVDGHDNYYSNAGVWDGGFDVEYYLKQSWDEFDCTPHNKPTWEAFQKWRKEIADF